jgi:alpha-glucosidase
MTDWSERTVEIPLSFLDAGQYEATIYADGANANRVATDYRVTKQAAGNGSRIPIVLKEGGGAVIRLRPVTP